MAIINNRVGSGYNVAGIILLGAGGCGKNTQMDMLLGQDGYQGVHIDLGEEIRHKIKKDPVFLKKHGHLVGSGKLLPDNVALQLVQEKARIIRQQGLIGMIGFPRNRRQSDMIDHIFVRPDNLMAVEFEIDLDTAVERAHERGRSDDKMIVERYNLWASERKGTIRKLEAKGVRVITIKAMGTPEFVFETFHGHVLDHVRSLKALADQKHGGDRVHHRPHTDRPLFAHPHSGPRATRD